MNWLTSKTRTRLFEVFSSLEKSTNIIQDDTQLEKLHSWLETSVNDHVSAASFLSHSEVTSFFRHAASEKQVHPYQALLLGLRLGPHLYATSFHADPGAPTIDAGDGCDPRAVPPWLEGVFQKAVETQSVWDEGSVRNAWVLGLATMCNVPNGLHWALKKGYLIKAADSIFDTSIFVSNKAQLLIIAIVPKLLLAAFPDQQDNPTCDLSKSVWERLVVLISGSLTHTGYDVKHVTSSLTLIRGLCKVTPAHVRGRLCFTDDVCEFAERACMWDDRSLAHQVITTLVDILALSDGSTSIQERVESFALHLLQDHIAPAMSLSSQLLNRGDSIHTERLREMVLLPMKLLLDDPIDNLDVTIVGTTKQALQERFHAKKVLLSSVNLLFTWTSADQAAVGPILARVLNVTLGCDMMMADVDDVTALRQAAYQNSKLQLAILDMFIKISQPDQSVGGKHPSDRDVIRQVFRHCLPLLKQPGIPPTLSTKAFTCLQAILHSMEEGGDDWLNPGSGQLLVSGDGVREVERVMLDTCSRPLEEFAELLLHNVCDIRWEVRDTAVVTLGSIIHQAKPGGVVVMWLEMNKLAQQVWQSVDDGESYVRAAAVTALTHLPRHPSLWEQLLTYCPQDEIFAKLVTVLTEDTEAFARRAAISLLCSWIQTAALSSHTDTIRTAINSAANDLDWEVKLCVLSYWDHVIQKDISVIGSIGLPAYTTGLSGMKHSLAEEPRVILCKQLEHLDKNGCLWCLMTCAKDYDRSVQYKACQILVTVRDACITHGLTTASGAMDNAEVVVTKKRRRQNGGHDNAMDVNAAPGDVDNGAPGSGSLTVEGFLTELGELGVDQLLLQSSKSIDDYVRDPESLFEDILTSLAKDDDENAIDCY